MPHSSESLSQDASQGSAPRRSALPSAVVNEDDDEPPIPNCRPQESGPSSLDPALPIVEARESEEDTVLRGRTATMVSQDPEKAAADVDVISVRERARRRIAAQHTVMGKLKLLFVAEQVGPPLPPPTYKESFMAVVRYSPLNFCLLFIPVGWALAYTNQNPTIVFAFSALGMIPLAALLGLGTEQLSIRTSSAVGALINMSLGNLVEMIISGIALRRCELEIVQSALLGGLLSNLLLVLGTAFMVGGLRFESQEFHPRVAQLNSSLMVVAVIAFIVPVAFNEVIGERLTQGTELPIILQLSRGSAVILIVIYLSYLVFQFYSHNHLFLDTITNTSYSSSSSSGTRRSSLGSHFNRRSLLSRIRHPLHPRRSSDRDPEAHVVSVSSISTDDSDDIEYPKMNTYSAVILLVVVTVLAYLTGEHLVDSLTEFTTTASISREWVTLIILPIVSNAAEHTTALIVASKGKFDLAMNVAVGSCIQISLFVYPILVFVAWGMGKPLTMLFDQLETLVLFFSVILVKFSVEDGKSHWLTGTILVCVYVLIALSFWNFPDTARLVQGSPIACT